MRATSLFDACSVIDFGVVSRIDLLAQHYAGSLVAAHVQARELGTGLAKGKPDLCSYDGSIWLATVELAAEEIRDADAITLRLGQRHRGEAESIAICLRRGYTFISNDRDALLAAVRRGVRIADTAMVLSGFVADAVLTLHDARALARAMTAKQRGVREGDVLEHYE